MSETTTDAGADADPGAGPAALPGLILDDAGGRVATAPLRLRRPMGARLWVEKAGALAFALKPGEKRYLLTEGLDDRPDTAPASALFETAPGDVVRLDAIAGAEALPRGCRLMILFHGRDGALVARESLRFDAERPFCRLAAPETAAGVGLILQLAGDGRLTTLHLGVEVGPSAAAARARAALLAGDLAVAAREAALTRRLQPHDPRLPRIEAQLAWASRDFALAGERFLALEAAGGLRGGDARRLVSALRRDQRLDEADAAYSRLFDGDDGDLASLTEWARIAENREDADEARRRWIAVVQRTGAARAVDRLTQMLDRTGHGEEVEPVLLDYLRDHPRNLLLRARLVARLQAQGRWEETLPLLDVLIAGSDGAARADWARQRAAAGVQHHEFGSSPPGGASAGRGGRGGLRRIDRWARYAAKGLEERATREIEDLAETAEPARVRAEALAVLAAADRARGPEGWLHALERVQTARSLDPDRAGLDAMEVRLLTDMGRLDEAASALEAAERRRPSANLTLAAANLARARDDGDAARLAIVNRIFAAHELARLEIEAGETLTLDTLRARATPIDDGPLVSVIVPVWNAATTLESAVRSLREQTWRRLEILVIDDGSTDTSASVAGRLAEIDPRVRLLRNPQNGGAYVSRNHGLAEARGALVTCHDADDWAHPQRIERQMRALQTMPEAVGNMSRCVTATTDMVFTTRGQGENGFRWNFSSVLFRREAALAAVGYWDEVRFGADGEYVARLRRAFGPYAIEKLDAGPLAIVRQSDGSLTGHAALGLTARGHTVRSAYRARFEQWHEDAPAAVRARGGDRPFAVPAVLRGPDVVSPDRFDVVLASDFRLTGGTTASNLQEILAQRGGGLTTGLIQLDSVMLRPETPLSPKIVAEIDYEAVHLLTSDRQVSAGTTVVRWPPAATDYNRALAAVASPAVSTIVNQTPWRGVVGGEAIYDPVEVDRQTARMFGHRPLWRPIGPVVRRALEPYAHEIAIAGGDWVNVLDLAAWGDGPRRPRRRDGPPAIGRHARDFPGKWPMNPADLLDAYPDDGSLDVRILGGARVAEEVLGRRTLRWTVHDFDTVSPRDYLAGLDVFVYFPDPSLDEAFGRAVLEAMAAGVPVLLPARFRPVFGEAALYATPQETRGVVERLMADPDHYEARTRAGLAFAAGYSHAHHVARLRALIAEGAG